MLKEYNKVISKRIKELIELRAMYHGNTYMQEQINKYLTKLYDIQREILRSM